MSVVAFCLCILGGFAEENARLGLRLPEGFQVAQFAGADLANDIYTLCFDDKGRVVVSGRGYIRILADDDNDGRADRAIPFTDGPADGATGLYWENRTLYYTGDGALRRLHDVDGDDKPDGRPELLAKLKTRDEHSAHAVRRGPDGRIYVLCGNNSDVGKEFAAEPSTPIRNPIAGCVLRFSPDFKASEILADGFRNPFGMDFNRDGALFTYDSDNERCVSLPWQEGTRVYHVLAGAHHGWEAPERAGTWRMPPYFLDVAEPLADLGRGSPTGVACYRAGQFPEKYQEGLFVADWTFGRIVYLALKPDGSTFSATQELFAEPIGTSGFAPTGLAVHPKTGELFVSIGGRGSRGAIYRIRYPSRPLGERSLLDRKKDADFEKSVSTTNFRIPFEEFDPVAARTLAGRWKGLEALRAGFDSRQKTDRVLQAIRANWDSTDRPIRQATARLIKLLPKESQQALLASADRPKPITTCSLGTASSLPSETAARISKLFAESNDASVRLDCARLMQIATGDLMESKAKGTVWEGYSRRKVLTFDHALLKPFLEAFPTGQWALDRELSRLFAMHQNPDESSIAKLAGRITPKSDPVDDIHFLIVLARIPGARSPTVTKQTATGLLELDKKLASLKRNRDRNWPLRVGEMHAELARKDSALNQMMVDDPSFGRPDHALYAHAKSFDAKKAAEAFLKRISADPDYELTPTIISLIGKLPIEQVRSLLRKEWSRSWLREAVVGVLSRQPTAEDLPLFLEALALPQLSVVSVSLAALEKLPTPTSTADVRTLVDALRRIPRQKETESLRNRLGDYLAKATGQNLGSDKDVWIQWFQKTHPREAVGLGADQGLDSTAWKKRLEGISWSSGDVERGRKIYQQTGCTGCHAAVRSVGAMGPDLTGISKRFSQRDLLAAVVEPSRDVPERYQAQAIATRDGEIFIGMVVYEAVDSLILQVSADQTLRIPVDQIATRNRAATSMMPTGLLDRLTDAQVADLFSFLQSL